jgi:hypothetical protein
MRILKAMLVVACIMSAISIFRPIVLLDGTFGIVSSIIDTAVFGCVFYGIHRRALLMWKLGFVIIVGLGAQFLMQSLTIWSSIVSKATNARIEFGFLTIVTLAVTTYWLFWWKRQRSYFVDGFE